MFLLLDGLDSKNKGLIIWKEERVPKICVPEKKSEKRNTGSRKKKVDILVGRNLLEVGGGLGDGGDAWR